MPNNAARPVVRSSVATLIESVRIPPRPGPPSPPARRIVIRSRSAVSTGGSRAIASTGSSMMSGQAAMASGSPMPRRNTRFLSDFGVGVFGTDARAGSATTTRSVSPGANGAARGGASSTKSGDATSSVAKMVSRESIASKPYAVNRTCGAATAAIVTTRIDAGNHPVFDPLRVMRNASTTANSRQPTTNRFTASAAQRTDGWTTNSMSRVRPRDHRPSASRARINVGANRRIPRRSRRPYHCPAPGTRPDNTAASPGLAGRDSLASLIAPVPSRAVFTSPDTAPGGRLSTGTTNGTVPPVPGQSVSMPAAANSSRIRSAANALASTGPYSPASSSERTFF